MVESELERKFHDAMIKIYRSAMDDCNYKPTRFLQMVNAHGGVEAAKILINSKVPSEGFTTLWEHNRLDLTVEAHAIKPEYQSLFTPEELERANERLRQYEKS